MGKQEARSWRCGSHMPMRVTAADRRLQTQAATLLAPHCTAAVTTPNPAVSPEARRHEPEAAVPSDIDPQPFQYSPQPPSGHSFRMVEGVMQVFSPDDRGFNNNLFPVRSAGGR